MSLAELEKKVLKVSAGELNAFMRWLDEYAVAAGKLHRFAKQADDDFKTGSCTEL